MRERVAVLGAGPMGLAVAYQLCLNGHEAVVYEADDRLGGMAACFDFNGIEIERFYHFHCTSDVAFLQVLDELNLSDKMRWTETKMGYWFQGKVQAWGNPIALLKFRGLSPIAKFRYGLHAFLSSKRNNWRSLDKMNASFWIRRWVGDQAYEVLWRRLFDLKFYHFSDTLSAAWIWSRIRRIGRSRYNLFREKLGYLEGGSATLLNAMGQAIEARGGSIHLRTPVTKVVIEKDKVTGVETKEGFKNFDKVISTAPLPYIPMIIPDLPQPILEKYRSINNIAVVCVIVKLAKPVTEYFWLNTNDPDMDIPGLVEFTNLYPLKQHIIYVPYYLPGDHPKFSLPDTAFLEKVKTYLLKINPNLKDEDILDMRASRYRFAQPVCEPGFLDKLPPAKLPVEGLWVADTSYYYPEDRGISESIDFGRSMAKQACP